MKLQKFSTCVVGALSILCAAAQAAPMTNTASVGVHAGLGVLGDSGGSHFDVGADASYAILPPLFVAGQFSYIDRGSISSAGNSATGSLYLLTGSLNYDAQNYIPGSFVGVAMGIGINHTSATIGTISASNTDSNFYIGPRVGYDYPLSSSFTIGGEGSWLLTAGNSAPNVLQVVAVLKYWL
jgi:hypothetical protein